MSFPVDRQLKMFQVGKIYFYSHYYCCRGYQCVYGYRRTQLRWRPEMESELGK